MKNILKVPVNKNIPINQLPPQLQIYQRAPSQPSPTKIPSVQDNCAPTVHNNQVSDQLQLHKEDPSSKPRRNVMTSSKKSEFKPNSLMNHRVILNLIPQAKIYLWQWECQSSLNARYIKIFSTKLLWSKYCSSGGSGFL